MVNHEPRIHVLGIESSCDDTGVSIIDDRSRILSNCINSQLKQHISFGGIIPVVAKEYHLNNIDHVAKEAFAKSGLESVKNDISAIAVTNRPGLNFSLKVGLKYAKKLALKYSKPVIPIHHMQAHALMPLLENRNIKFPFIALLISGGHAIISIVQRYDKFQLLGESLDDSPGHILDNFARRLRLKNLGYPYDSISGGASIELLSRQPGADRFKYFNHEQSIPMLRTKGCDLSFSGYNGIMHSEYEKVDQLWSSGNRNALIEELGHICGSIQRVILLQLVKRLQRALLFYRTCWRYENEGSFADSENQCDHLGFGIRTRQEDDDSCLDVVVSGGVAANQYISNGLRLACGKIFDPPSRVFLPSKALCSDNGLMIAWNGLYRYLDSTKYTQLNNSQDLDLDNMICCDQSSIDALETKPVQPIGESIRNHVTKNQLKLRPLGHPEFRIEPSNGPAKD